MADIADKTQNVSITNNDETKTVTVTTDGSKERLDVNAVVSFSDLPSTNNISDLVSSGKVYSLAKSINCATAGNANPIILIRNPGASGKTFYLHSMRIGMDVQNNYLNVVTWHNPTITTVGTTYTPVNRCLGGGFGASAMNVYTLPTVSANGTEISNVEVAENGNSIEEAINFTVQLKAGEDLMITGDPKSNNRIAVVTIVWAEVDD